MGGGGGGRGEEGGGGAGYRVLNTGVQGWVQLQHRGEPYLLLSVGELGQAGGGGSVVFEVTPDQVPGSQGGHQAELPGQHGAADHSGQLGCVLA